MKGTCTEFRKYGTWIRKSCLEKWSEKKINCFFTHENKAGMEGICWLQKR